MLYWLCCWCDELFRWFSLLLSWPAVALVMFIIVICGFKKNLRALIDRLKSVSTKYGSATFGDPKVIGRSKDTVFPDVSTTQLVDVSQKVSMLLQRAKQFVDKNDNEKAIDALLEANRVAPNQIVILHNLGVLLIRLGKANNRTEYLIQAEVVCKQALCLNRPFPYGTLYNLARAQAAIGNIDGLKETLRKMSKIKLPDNLAKAIVDGDADFEHYVEVKELQEYKDLKRSLTDRFQEEDSGN